MTNKSNFKLEKPTPIDGSKESEQPEIISDSERRAKYGVNRSRKIALSKREMMEDLSRERFPWEE
jgi:hypothetical protein